MISKTISLTALFPALAVSAALVTGSAQAQDPVHWTAEIDEESLAPGAKITVSVKATIEAGWYIYSITQGEGGPVPSKISLSAEQPFTLAGKVEGTKPKVKFDQNFQMQVEMHEGKVSYTVPVQVSVKAGSDVTEMEVRARYQACTNRVCLPAQTEKIAVPVKIVPKSKIARKKKG
ncbi:MAG: protein-disulfide reductase DsbD N-terminal domain-containing protein [Gemmatimonadota bacterium]|nr:protein-disulfide reductase DsbD N-terminal domain-containing protein [Gemmatimonadota bacterium]